MKIKVNPTIKANDALDLIIKEQTDLLYNKTKFPCAVGWIPKHVYREALESEVRMVIHKTYPDLVNEALKGGSVEVSIKEKG